MLELNRKALCEENEIQEEPKLDSGIILRNNVVTL